MGEKSDGSPVATLVASTDRKTEAEFAEELKRDVRVALEPVLVVMQRAADAGLAIGWEPLGPQSPTGRMGVGRIFIQRTY